MPISIQLITTQLGSKPKMLGYNDLVFSGGEVQIRLDDYYPDASLKCIFIHAVLRNSDDIMRLLLITDALRNRYGDVPINLICPYFPYARQDRVCYKGEALSARVMAKLVNAQNYASVEVWDAHSDVVPALLDRCTNVPVSGLIHSVCHSTVLIAPDAGAIKRVKELATFYDLPFIVAEKMRSTKDGSITGVKIDLSCVPQDANLLVVDDICDGGRTFVELGKILLAHMDSNEMLPPSLYVTHGIFSNGFTELGYYYRKIYCANIFPETFPSFVYPTSTH